jgi:hypothetical protein
VGITGDGSCRDMVRTDEDDLGHRGSDWCIVRIKLAQGDDLLTCTMLEE